jgi:TusA-related sulfurtransferase
MDSIQVIEKSISTGDRFLEALAARDFERLQTLFANPVRFRALVPRGLREAGQPHEAAAWFKKWFADSDYFSIQSSTVDQVADRISVSYRFRGHDASGWYVVEQKAYCQVQDDAIQDMALVCSGFCKDPSEAQPVGLARDQSLEPGAANPKARFAAQAYYDAGSLGCAEGPMEEIARLIGKLGPGQSLEVHASDPSVAADLPAWCRLSGNDFISHEGENYLIRKKN